MKVYYISKLFNHIGVVLMDIIPPVSPAAIHI